MKGKRRGGRQKKRWEDNINEWTGMDFASSTKAAENRTRWKGIAASSSVEPQQQIEQNRTRSKIALVFQYAVITLKTG